MDHSTKETFASIDSVAITGSAGDTVNTGETNVNIAGSGTSGISLRSGSASLRSLKW